MLFYVIGFGLVAFFFNLANKNIANRRGLNPKRKSRKQALKEWAEFEEKYPPKSKPKN